MTDGKYDIFLSYCWDDNEVANSIYDELSIEREINLHRDSIDIGRWESIKKYMQSIERMDYTILLISEAYLKSANCMYEVLEVMKSSEYADKIFPVVIYTEIYKPEIRARCVKYWEEKLKMLQNELVGISPQNMGTLSQDLKHYQNIAASMAEFLTLVAEKNNPRQSDAAAAIKEKLSQKGMITSKMNMNTFGARDNSIGNQNIFTQLGISSMQMTSSYTDLDINRFMMNSYQEVRHKLNMACDQFTKVNQEYSTTSEDVDSRDCIFRFYKKGMLQTGIKLFLSETFGNMSIGVSTSLQIYGNGQSWNAMYTVDKSGTELKLENHWSFGNRQAGMSANEVVKDIWENYIANYLN